MIFKFQINMDRVHAKVSKISQNSAKKLAEQIYNGVVSRSPVDSGSYRASWLVSDGVAEFVYNEYPEGAAAPPPSFSYEPKAKFPRLFITNGAPYSKLIEYGWSEQAPQGVLRVTLASLGLEQRDKVWKGF